MIAEQIPAKLVPDVVKNTALKVLHRLPAHDDRQVVGRGHEPGRGPVPAGGLAAAGRGGGVRRRDGPAAADPGARSAAAGSGRPAPGRAGRRRRSPIRGRARSAACGPTCTAGRACTLLEIRAADLLASSPDDAWLRVWAEALVLAHLTNRPLPVVPAVLRAALAGLDAAAARVPAGHGPRPAAGGRALAVRARYDPERLAAAVRRHRAAGCWTAARARAPCRARLGDPAAAVAARDRAGLPAGRGRAGPVRARRRGWTSCCPGWPTGRT